MLLGIRITSTLLIVGGVSIFVLLLFQVLLGLRRIRFKGKLHLQVHKVVAYVMVVIAVFHALGALAFFGYI